MDLNDYYRRTFIKDLKIEAKSTKVCVTGVVLSYKVKDKVILFTIDDSTGIILCLHFKSPHEKNDFFVGTMITIFGEYEVNKYLNDVEYRVKVQKYSILEDVSEELYSYLETFVEMQVRAKNPKSEPEVFQEPKPYEKDSKKLPPLSKESVNIKLRTLIFKCLEDHIILTETQNNKGLPRTLGQEKHYLTFMDIFAYPALITFMEKENVSGKNDLSRAISDMEKLMLINPMFAHTQEDYEGVKYEINSEKILGLKDKVLKEIKEAGSRGIHIEDLFILINSYYSTDTFIISKEFLWQIAEDLYNENLIHLPKKHVFHYLEKLC